MNSAHAVGQVPASVVKQYVGPDPSEGFSLSAHTAVQGLTIPMPMLLKSRTLRVATAMSRERAIAAI
ncbi:MAG: hypothetical protein OXF88_01605 [Rhodobacteraceae bacterium]|nr:hypothetical protein [Paracoccaceae bacterium]MCY4139913.1 hypothetical protein [Paracoccaceae bacterium]